MSRAYRIKVRESLSQNIKTNDKVVGRLEIIDVLPPEIMEELICKELEERGFTKGENGEMRKQDGEVTIVILPCSREIIIETESSEDLTLEKEKETSGYDDYGPAASEIEKKAKEQIRKELEVQLEKHKEELQKKTTARLEEKTKEISKELNEIANKVTSDALKQKASQLGQIKEMTEDKESGSLTIVLEV